MPLIQAESSYIDLAQLVLYAFWIFFAGLIYYLHRENKREGYPLESDRSDRAPRVAVQGWPRMPEPKTYKLAHGGTAVAPNGRKDTREVKAVPVAGYPGAPLEPTGDPMVDGVGPAAYAQRADEPDLTYDGEPKLVPLRVATDHVLESRDPDPRGMAVIGADGKAGGTVRDVWVDRSECLIRYLEVETGSGTATRRVLLPMNFARVTRGGVLVKSITSAHFAKVPGLRNPDVVTLLEEDKIMGFYGGGHLYALPQRTEPLI
jgi:photosynthetic reaction center H subunit